MRHRIYGLPGLVALALLALAARGAGAQATDDAVAAHALATREALEALTQRLERGTDDPRRAELLARVRARLATGDFRPGDRVLLEVRAESSLTDTFTVDANRELLLPSPTVGTASLAGVLRSELQDHLARYVARFLQNPVVRARPLVRLSIQGEVERPGYHEVATDAVIAAALMAAGGTTADADTRKLRVERDGEPVWKGPALRQAIADGRTIGDAGLRDGDEILVPRRGGGGVGDGLRFMWVIVSLAGGIFGLSRAF